MSPSAERITWRTLVGLLALAMMVAAVAAPIAVWVDAGSRPLVIRLATAVFCLMVVYRLVCAIREEAGIDQVSPAEIATRPQQESLLIDPLLVRLTGELRDGVLQRTIKSALWQRLQRLAERRAVTLPSELAPRPGRQLTMTDTERAISCLEDAT
jgi:hypothetical protein